MKPIKKIERICDLAKKGKVVYHVRWDRKCPAAWIQNMPVHLIVGWVRMKWLYEVK